MVPMDSRPADRAILYRELYGFLTAPDRATLRPRPASALDLPRPLARSLVHFYSLLRAETIAASDDTLADQVAVAVSSWFASLWEDLLYQTLTEPLADSTTDTVGDLSTEQLRARIESARRSIPEYDQEWSALSRKVDVVRTSAQRRACQHRFETIRRDALVRRRDNLRERAIRQVANPLADHLNELVPDLQRRQKTAREIFGVAGSWDVLATDHADINWPVLERSRRYLNELPGLEQLCARLVGGSGTEETRDVEIEREITVECATSVDRGLGEVDGLTGSSSVTGALTSELGLLAFPATEDLFARKLFEHALLSLHHVREKTITRSTSRIVRERSCRPRRRGPVVLCVDTSGSMRGLPETVVRATILGVLREALRKHRALTIFLVAKRLERLETPHSRSGYEHSLHDQSAIVQTSPPPVIPESLIHRLAALFTESLIDGSDISPAMENALTMLEGAESGEVSDVVVISDTRFPRFFPRHLNRMYALQNTGEARFHCLTINQAPAHDPLNVFDYRWFFDTRPHPSYGLRNKDRVIGVDAAAFRQF